MNDSYGRTIDYMRISITDRCNLRCKYCMPYGVESVSHKDILTYDEIYKIVLAGAGLGIKHLKVTGGEPLVRRGCCELIRKLKTVPGIEHVTLTTNGILLEEYLEELIRSGIDGINISLDTTDREAYRQITGQDSLEAVLRVVKKAAYASVPVKINAVSLDWEEMGRLNKAENWKTLVLLAQQYPVDVRFIEMMPIGCGKMFKTVNHKQLLEEMMQAFPGMEREKDKEKRHGFGPAVYYRIPGFSGSIGLISAIHGKFCESCNRVRLTAQGMLKTCLCFEDGADLRAVLREDGEKNLEEVMKTAIMKKPAAHCFEKPEKITEMHPMAAIGG